MSVDKEALIAECANGNIANILKKIKAELGYSDKIEIIRVVIEHQGLDGLKEVFTYISGHYRFAFEQAIQYGKLECLLYILNAAKEKKQKLKIPLVRACLTGDADSVKRLIAKSSELGFKKILLHAAVIGKNSDIIETLLEKGFTQNVKDASGRLAIDYSDSDSPQALFDKYSTEHVVALREELRKHPHANDALKNLAKLNGGPDTRVIYENAQMMLAQSDPADQKNYAINMLKCAYADQPPIDKTIIDAVNAVVIAQFDDAAKRLDCEQLKTACHEFSTSFLNATSRKILDKLPEITAIISSSEPSIEKIKALFDVGYLRRQRMKIPDTWHALFTVLDLLCAKITKSDVSCDIKPFVMKDRPELESELYMAVQCNMHHYASVLISEQLPKPQNVVCQGQYLLKAAYDNNDKTLFELIHQHDEIEYGNNDVAIPGAVHFQCHDILKSEVSFLYTRDHVLDSGETVLHMACRNQDIESIKMLIDAGWTFGVKNSSDETPAQLLEEDLTKQLTSWAFKDEKEKIIDELIANGLLSTSDAVHLACSLESSKLVRHLLGNQDPLALTDYPDKNPLHVASEKANLGILIQLLTKLSDSEIKRDFVLKADSKSKSALHYGVMSGKPEIIDELFKSVADLPFAYAINNGSTPMQLALQQKDNAVAIALFKAGESLVVDPKNPDHQTIEKEIESLKLMNAKAALRRASEQFSGATKKELKAHVLNLCCDVKDNDSDNITLLNEVRKAIEEKDVSNLQKSAETYQATHGSNHRTATIIFTVAAIALVIVGAFLLVLLTPLTIGAIVLGGGVTSGVIAGTLFYKSRHSADQITNEVTEMTNCLQPQASS